MKFIIESDINFYSNFYMLMKNIFYSLLLMLIIFSGVSCTDKSFLEETVTSDLDRETIFSDSAYTEGFLTDIYRSIGFDVALNRFKPPWPKTIQAGGLQTMCDELEFRVISDITTDVLFVTGSVNPVSVSNDVFKTCYENIRKVNIFFENVDNSPLSASLRTKYKAEARFLRAWYYFILVKHYGGVPLIGDVVYDKDDEMKTERDTYEDCIDYIVKETQMAARDLTSVKPRGRYNGRIGKGACYAFISRVKLYAASPLFNGSDFGSDAPGFKPELIRYLDYKKERWKEAMDWADSVRNTGLYYVHVNNTPVPGEGFYEKMFPSTFTYDKKGNGVDYYAGTILEHKKAESNERENLFQPPSRNSGGGGYPYQEFVDMFPMRNGKAITDPASGYDPNNPYANRDPRFKNSVLCDLDSVAAFISQQVQRVQISIYLDRDNNNKPATKDGFGTGTPTGYYPNKMVHRLVDGGNGFTYQSQSMPLLRYEEILLNYAEAANEWYASPNKDIYDCLTKIREAAGIAPGTDGLYGLKTGMTQEEMREAIHLERRIELALEGHRFFDVRRWMIADKTDNQMMHGMKITRNTDKTNPAYDKVEVRKHVFRKAMYLWPIPNSEVSKAPDKMLQNPYY